MTSLVAKQVPFAGTPVRLLNPNMCAARSIPLAIESRVPPSIVWLRQVRRSAWILIAVCSLFRVGDTLVGEGPAFAAASAIAAGS